MLSGAELVKKGVTRLDASLPELGLKDVFPNGSWLEQKQIQAALEAKKHLIEVERIQKRVTLSQAEWIKDLKLAEVSHKVGGYWQYLGHNVGPKLYLKPEEALFLLETNCLQLNYGGIKVSLQQAYTLLIEDNLNLIKYKVYASLSRIGYKVFTHKKEESNFCQNNDTGILVETMNTQINTDKNVDDNQNTDRVEEHSQKCQESLSKECVKNSEVSPAAAPFNASETQSGKIYKNMFQSYQNKLTKLKNRKITLGRNTHDYFNNIPHLVDKGMVTIQIPNRQYIPSSMILKETYTINLLNLPDKKSSMLPSRIYTSSDEASGNHVKRIRSESNGSYGNHYHSEQHRNRNNPQSQYRQICHVRPFRLNYINFNTLFQNTYQQAFFPSPFQNFGPHIFQRQLFSNLNTVTLNQHRHQTYTRNEHVYYQKLKELATKLKILVYRGRVQTQNILALQRLVHVYNVRYNTKLRLDNNFDIVNEANTIETIEIDDDEPQRKKAKQTDSIENNLDSVKAMALELKDLEKNGKASGRHRRVFSKLLKTFNKCYNVDYYLNSSYELLSKEHINLDSSSENDCEIQKEPVKGNGKHKRGKKLRNPFNILKRLSENKEAPSCSNTDNTFIEASTESCSKEIKTSVSNNWLPNEADFGRAEIPRGPISDPLFDIRKTALLLDFLKFNPDMFNNWLDVKIAFLENLKDNIAESHKEFSPVHSNDECLVTSIDSGSIQSIFEKLSIIKSNKACDVDSTLSIGFDVYNRDVENFKKTNPPKPHFRVICLDESMIIPSAAEFENLQTQYQDDIPLVYAIVSISSISYVQVKPMEMPSYIPTTI